MHASSDERRLVCIAYILNRVGAVLDLGAASVLRRRQHDNGGDPVELATVSVELEERSSAPASLQLTDTVSGS